MELGLTHATVGLLIFLSFVGFFCASLCSGFACDWMTDKPILAIGFFILGGSVLLFLSVRTFTLLLLVYFLARFGMGAIDITGCTQGVRLFTKNAAIKVNILHFLFALGATIAPFASSRMLDAGIDWRVIFALFAVPCLTFCIITLFTKFTPQQSRPLNNILSEFASIIPDRRIWILSGLLAVAIISEANLIDWIKNYAVEIGSFDNVQSGNLIGLFYFFLMISRIISGYIAQRIGVMHFYLYYLMGAIMLFVCLVLFPFNMLFFITIGWFAGPLFPIVTIMAAQQFPNKTGSAMGIVFAVGGLSGTFNSFLVGVMHDIFGTRIGFSFILIGMSVGIPIILHAKKHFRSPPT